MLPISIYLQPPYIAVQQTASIYYVGLPAAEPLLSFGYVQGINYNTVSYQVGNRILYPQQKDTPVVIILGTQYSVIDERNIILIEPPQALV